MRELRYAAAVGSGYGPQLLREVLSSVATGEHPAIAVSTDGGGARSLSADRGQVAAEFAHSGITAGVVITYGRHPWAVAVGVGLCCRGAQTGARDLEFSKLRHGVGPP